MDLSCISNLQYLCNQYNIYKSAQSNCIATSCDMATINSYQTQLNSLLAQIKIQQDYCKAQIDSACDVLPQVQYYLQNPTYYIANPINSNSLNPNANNGGLTIQQTGSGGVGNGNLAPNSSGRAWPTTQHAQ